MHILRRAYATLTGHIMVIEDVEFPEELIVNSDYRLYESYIGRRDE